VGVLDLPDGIIACLFDADALLTQRRRGADVVVQDLRKLLER
jgi:hypothetical protein